MSILSGHRWRLTSALLVASLVPIAAGVHPAAAQISASNTKGSHTFSSLILTSDPTPTQPSLDVNALLGANTFYQAGYTGKNAVAANIEGGYFWNGHQSLQTNTFQLPVAGGGVAQYDAHATEVTSALGGRPIGSGDLRRGIAYDATLWSGAIATVWHGTSSFDVSDASFFTPYATALITGVNGVRADVTNSSFGYTDPAPTEAQGATGTNVTGADTYTVAIDGIAAQSGRTMVFAAGNAGSNGTNHVTDPAAGYNTISVGALTFVDNGTGTHYGVPASFSSGGASDYQGPVNPLQPGGAVTQAEHVANIRARVDILAPGDYLSVATYGGGSADFVPVGGTSFAAPIVAGGAALLCDVGNTNYQGFSTNANVIKAVLLNSADKIYGWDNGQVTINGTTTTTQALDYGRGAGALDLNKAFTQYTSGVTDVAGLGGGTGLASVGWDYGEVDSTRLIGSGQTVPGYNDYFLGDPLLGGTKFTATLNWFVDRTYAGLTDAGALNTDPVLDANGNLVADPHDLGFVNLNLELWRVTNGTATDLIGLSSAAYINTQHFFLDIPTTGDYLLRVTYAGERYDVNGNIDSQKYGLAWSGTSVVTSAAAPEPGTLVLVFAGGLTLTVRFRRVRAR